LRSQLSGLDFTYSDPYPNFDRSKVKGLVATLTSLSDKHFDKSTALEIAAGGRLYNVVVQDEKVGKDLLENGKLKKRVTIIPLNKINAFRASAAVSTLLPSNWVRIRLSRALSETASSEPSSWG
jgi:structural maintenance of chromosome 2